MMSVCTAATHRQADKKRQLLRPMVAIVGDHHYCQTVQGAVNPLKEVLDYIRRNPETCKLEELTA